MFSRKPTHGLPLTADELRVPRNQGGKGWQAGARFQWVSHFGSKSSNSKPKEGARIKGRGGLKPTGAVIRPVTVPGWARKYRQEET